MIFKKILLIYNICMPPYNPINIIRHLLLTPLPPCVIQDPLLAEFLR